MTAPVGRGWGLAWRTLAWLLTLSTLLPIAVVLASIAGDSDGVFAHIAETRLATYATNTVLLTLGVAAVTLALGVPTAWLVTMCRFPGRWLLSILLLLPLAVPAYIAAYSVTDLLQPAGPLRAIAIGEDGVRWWWPRVRSLPGATLILALCLYPYVYLAARAAFIALPASLLDASKTLGFGSIGTFARVVVPVSVPTIGAGLLLVMMETVSDFGAVDYCAVDTFATGVYRAWATLGSPIAAAQLGSVVLGAVGVVLLIVASVRGRRRFDASGGRSQRPRPVELRGVRALLAAFVCAVPVLGGFVLPAGWLAVLAIDQGDQRAVELLFDHGLATVFLSALAAVLVVGLGLVLVEAKRMAGGWATRVPVRIGQLGYAVPGTVLAVGLLIPLAWLDHRLNDVWNWLTGERLGLVLTGTIVAVLVGYQTRFMAVGVGLLRASLDRVPPRLDEAATTLGCLSLRIIGRIHLPMLLPPICAAMLLVFVDAAKELPMTLMLRPFGMDTLAVRVYQLASDERLGEASTGALAIVLVGLIPVIVLSRSMGVRTRSALEVER
ncbi:MAG: iron ABC transporter permease [Phycisphaerales bacterium]|nr:iron ABC transporter permease [Phycisphaerales bacterium]